MTNTYFATAIVSARSIGITIRADNIGTAFEVAKDCLQTLHPASEVIVQGVQHINDEFLLTQGEAQPESPLVSDAPGHAFQA